jgi:hypothetical protein
VGVPPPVPPTVTIQGVPSTNELVGRSRDWLKIKFEKGKPKEYIEAVKASIRATEIPIYKTGSTQREIVSQDMGPMIPMMINRTLPDDDLIELAGKISSLDINTPQAPSQGQDTGVTRSGRVFRNEQTPSGAMIIKPEFKPDM